MRCGIRAGPDRAHEGEPSAASPHGMRAAFRSWCRATKVRDDVAERALAHAREDATQAAYDREELLEARREVMEFRPISARRRDHPAAKSGP